MLSFNSHMLNVGDKAPLFSLKNQKNETIVLKELLADGHKVMLVVYPKDDTPGCTAQMCRVRDDYSEFEKIGVKVFGLNHGDEASHNKFIEKYNFPFDILIDENRKIIKEYGSTKMFFKNETTQRSAFVIDTDGKIIFAQKGQQDNQQILDLLKK
jgi:thioredoxin-dependent peroxiredoxin